MERTGKCSAAAGRLRPSDAVALVWSQRQSKIKFAYCRVICDLVCVALGVILLLIAGKDFSEIFGSVGIGTIITAFFMGPLITFFNVHVAQPMLGKPKEKQAEKEREQ